MINLLEDIISLHEKMRGAYFYTPPQSAASRRRYEQRNSQTTEFLLGNDEITVKQKTNCSCKNVYYKMKIFLNGEETTKDIRFIKKILKERCANDKAGNTCS